MQSYYESVAEWGDVLRDRFQSPADHTDWGYYGRGGNVEDDVRPITYAALVNAFLSEVEPPANAPDRERRDRMRRDAVAALKYLTQSHVTGGGACLNGKPWGDQWQSALWARAAGLGGWILWPHLDDQMKLAVARLIEQRQPSRPEIRVPLAHKALP